MFAQCVAQWTHSLGWACSFYWSTIFFIIFFSTSSSSYVLLPPNPASPLDCVFVLRIQNQASIEKAFRDTCLLCALCGESVVFPTWLDAAGELRSLEYKYSVLKKAKHWAQLAFWCVDALLGTDGAIPFSWAHRSWVSPRTMCASFCPSLPVGEIQPWHSTLTAWEGMLHQQRHSGEVHRTTRCTSCLTYRLLWEMWGSLPLSAKGTSFVIISAISCNSRMGESLRRWEGNQL